MAVSALNRWVTPCSPEQRSAPLGPCILGNLVKVSSGSPFPLPGCRSARLPSGQESGREPACPSPRSADFHLPPSFQSIPSGILSSSTDSVHSAVLAKNWAHVFSQAIFTKPDQPGGIVHPDLQRRTPRKGAETCAHPGPWGSGVRKDTHHTLPKVRGPDIRLRCPREEGEVGLPAGQTSVQAGVSPAFP